MVPSRFAQTLASAAFSVQTRNVTRAASRQNRRHGRMVPAEFGGGNAGTAPDMR